MSNETLLSLDPGSHKCGFALWQDGNLKDWGVWTAPQKMDVYDRIGILMDNLHKFLMDYLPDAIAIEDPEGYEDKNQRFLSLVVGAVFCMANFYMQGWYPYNQAKAKASCVLRGTSPRDRTKEAVRLAIEQLHPQAEGAPEDAIDAIAVGECYLAEMREKGGYFLKYQYSMFHVASLSGGSASAVASDRMLTRYGRDNCLLWFADTKWEDEDLYRFLDDLETYWEKQIVRVADGRTPLEVAEERQIIPNQKIAPCSHVLKQEMFKKFLATIPKPVTVHLGLDWTEEHRMARPKAEYEDIEGVTVDFPLMWNPKPWGKYSMTIAEWGIKPPRLYEYGFPHNNCGGRCVRQGITEWLRLKRHFPERFREVADWEQAQRAKGGPRANYAIARDQSEGQVRPLTLYEVVERFGNKDISQSQFEGDAFGCFCEY